MESLKKIKKTWLIYVKLDLLPGQSRYKSTPLLEQTLKLHVRCHLKMAGAWMCMHISFVIFGNGS